MLVIDAACAGAVTTTVIAGAGAPAASVGRVHVTDMFAAFVHAQPPPAADTNVTPAGSVSSTDTLAASDGPAFATTREYVTVPAAVTVAGPDLHDRQSADALTVVVTDDVLFARFGSASRRHRPELVSDAACAGPSRRP